MKFEIKDVVAKKSRKPFQNGEATAVIEGFGTMYIPKVGHTGLKPVQAVKLVGCPDYVELARLVVVAKPEAPIA